MSTTTVTWKIVCHWLLAPPMPLQCGLKYSPCSTEWIDVYYKHICGNILILWNRLFMISTRDKNPCRLETVNSLKQLGYESCPLHYTVTSIEEKVFTFKHGLNIGWSIHIQAINNSSPSTMNKRKFVLQELLTRIRFTKRYYVWCRFVPIISV